MERSTDETTTATKLTGAIEVHEGQIRSHLAEIVRGTVEETLNVMLDADADRLCGAGRYERSEERRDTRGRVRTGASCRRRPAKRSSR